MSTPDPRGGWNMQDGPAVGGWNDWTPPELSDPPPPEPEPEKDVI